MKEYKQMTYGEESNNGCLICTYQYDQIHRIPRILPKCNHTFCTKCIDSKTIKRGTKRIFICYDCNQQTTIKNGAADIPKNERLLQIIKNNQQSNQQNINICLEHKKQFQFCCKSCNNVLICSQCALFGKHKSHVICNLEENFKNEGHTQSSCLPTNAKQSIINEKQIKQLHDLFDALAEVAEQKISSGYQQALQQQTSKHIKEQLSKEIKEHFKQYYKTINKIQQKLLSEVATIKIDTNVKNALKSVNEQYVSLRNNLNAIESGTNGCKNQEFLEMCETFKGNLEHLEEHCQKGSKTIINRIKKKLGETLIVKIHEVPFSLKDSSVIKLGEDRNRDKKNQKQKESLQTMHRQKNVQVKKQQKKVKQDKRHEETLCEDQKNKEKHQEQKKNIEKKKHEETKHKTNAGQNRDKKYMSEEEYKQSREGKGSTGLSRPLKNLPVVIQKEEKQQKQEELQNNIMLLFVRPTKQLNVQTKSRYYEIIKHIDRQQASHTLQLIGMEINDQLLAYLLDYIKTKKMYFNMLKLVKNSITDEGFNMLLGYLLEDESVQVLNMTGNMLSNKCLLSIIMFARINQYLKTIYLSNNKVGGFAVKSKKKQLDQFQIEIIL